MGRLELFRLSLEHISAHVFRGGGVDVVDEGGGGYIIYVTRVQK